MGWWEDEYHGKSVLIGDGPLDVLDQTFKRIAREYKRDDRRTPTVEEVAKTLEIAIKVGSDILFGELDDQEISEVVIKLKKRPKRPNYGIGDYVAMPLPCGGFGFAKIKDIVGKIGLLVDLLELYSKEPVSLGKLKGKPVLYEELSDKTSIEDRSWHVIHTDKAPVIVTRNAAESSREFDKQFSRLGGVIGSGNVPRHLEKKLKEKGLIADS